MNCEYYAASSAHATYFPFSLICQPDPMAKLCNKNAINRINCLEIYSLSWWYLGRLAHKIGILIAVNLSRNLSLRRILMAFIDVENGVISFCRPPTSNRFYGEQ